MFNDVELKKYLNEMPYAAQWAAVDGVDDVAKLEPSSMLQLDEANPSSDALKTQYAAFLESLEKLATSPSSALRSEAQIVRDALQRLQEAEPSQRLDNPQFYSRLREAEERHISERVSDFVDKLAGSLSGSKYVSAEQVDQMRASAGLPPEAMSQIVHKLQSKGIRPIQPLPGALQQEIEQAFPFGIMQALYPENYTSGAPKSSYTIFPPYFKEAKKTVTRNDVDNAIEWFTRSPNTLRQKTAAAKLRAQAGSDLALHNAIIAFHLALWDEVHGRRAFRQDVEARLKSFGLVETDIAQLAGDVPRASGGASASVKPKVEPKPKPEPKAEPKPRSRPKPKAQRREDPAEVGRRAAEFDHSMYGPVQTLLDQKKVTQAAKLVGTLKSQGKVPKSGVGTGIVAEVETRKNDVRAAVTAAKQALAQRDAALASKELERATAVSIDHPELGDIAAGIAALEQEMEQELREQERQQQHRPTLFDDDLKRPLGFLPRGTTSSTPLALVIMVPAVLIDQFMAPRWPIPIAPDDRLVPGMIAGLAFGWFAAHVRKKEWGGFMSFVVLTLIVASLLADGYFVSVLGIVLIWFAGSTLAYNAEMKARRSPYNSLSDILYGGGTP